MSKLLITFLIIITSLMVIFAHEVITTYVIAVGVAYLLQPLAKKLSEYLKMPYKYCAIIVFIIFCSLVMILLSLLLPALYFQLQLLIKKITQYQTTLQSEILPAAVHKMDEVNPQITEHLRVLIKSVTSDFGSSISGMGNYFWHSLLNTINIISLGLLMPVITFYLLKDWPVISIRIRHFLRSAGLNNINLTLIEIDQLLSTYIRGILNVCLILAGYYILALSCIRFDLAIIIGLASGFAILLPFIGPLIAIISCLSISYLSHGTSNELLFISIIYLVGQSAEGILLTPKIIGDRIGLHPIIILFAALTGGHLFGIAGVLIAIPLAGISKILLGKLLQYSVPTKL